MKKIPSKLSLLGLEFSVRQIPYAALQKVRADSYKVAGDEVPSDEVVGLTVYSQQTLYVVAKDPDRYSEEFRLSVFYHELTHALLYMTGYPDLHTDEKLVDVLGNLIMQAEKTAVYN